MGLGEKTASRQLTGDEVRDPLEKATLLGSIEHFDPQSEGIQEYIERVEQYFEANSIVGEEKDQGRSAFLTCNLQAAEKLARARETERQDL